MADNTSSKHVGPLPVKVKLDKERTLIYTHMSEYDMGLLPRAFTVQDLRLGGHTFAALCAWVFVCLSEQDKPDFKSPRDLVKHITEKNVDDVFNKFVETWTAGQTKEDKDDPNA